MFLSMIKEQIKEELREELKLEKEQIEHEIVNCLFLIIDLEKKSDKEIAKEYKHDKFSDIPKVARAYFERRFEIVILKEWQTGLFHTGKYSVYEYEYISDFIEQNILEPKRHEAICCASTSHVIPAKKKATKRKK